MASATDTNDQVVRRENIANEQDVGSVNLKEIILSDSIEYSNLSKRNDIKLLGLEVDFSSPVSLLSADIEHHDNENPSEDNLAKLVVARKRSRSESSYNTMEKSELTTVLDTGICGNSRASFSSTCTANTQGVSLSNEELTPHEPLTQEDQIEIRSPPSGLIGLKLLPFQVEGASWMYHQEYHMEDIRGGILADEMGMGKTIQTIVTMLDNRPLLQHCKPRMKHQSSAFDIGARRREESLWGKALVEWKTEMDVHNATNIQLKPRSPLRAGTLIVCPLIALSQWKTEIEKFTENATFTICIYHGPKRESQHSIMTLAKYDIVITTFQMLELDFRKMTSPNKVRCPNCNLKFKIDKLPSHLKNYCGRDKPDFKSLHEINIDKLKEDAVAGSKQSVLHCVTWWRVVLDEAHAIKSRSSQTAAAAFALTSIHRWCLSGTPLQNRVGELYSLTRFLRLDPMAYYFCDCMGCDCKSLHYRMNNGYCQDCEHALSYHRSYFNKHISNPIQRDGCGDEVKQAMFTLEHEILDKCVLRRTKKTRADDMGLPPRLVTIRYVKLHPVEDDFYQSLYTTSKATFDDYVQADTVVNNYAHIFVLLTKLRQAVCHPFMVIHSAQSRQHVSHNIRESCDICHEPTTDKLRSKCCGSAFCSSCVADYMVGSDSGETPCPSCNSFFVLDQDQSTACSTKGVSLMNMNNVAAESILRHINLDHFASSTKIEVLVQELVEMRKKRPGNKALVFSQFVTMLDLVRWRMESDPCLESLGLGVQILHGGMSVESRNKAIKEFREESSCRVLLMSLKAAGVALNLTVASECYLLDLWWNPSAEMQAIDRTHRLGQYRPIRAVRIVAQGTVEERILQLQEKKRILFDGTVGRDESSLQRLTQADLAHLFYER